MKKFNNELQPVSATAINGAAGCGKDFLAAAIKSELEYGHVDVTIDKFANTMKSMLNEIFSEIFKDDIANILNKPIDDIWPNGQLVMSDDEFEIIKNNGNCKFKVSSEPDTLASIRQVLQILGTDVIRNIEPNFHIAQLSRRMLDNPNTHFLIPDARFDNENLFVKNLNILESQAERIDYLSAVASLEKNKLPDMSEVYSVLIEKFGDGDLAKKITEKIECYFYDERFIVDSLNNRTKDIMDSMGKPYFFSKFRGDSEKGNIAIYRGEDQSVDRKMDPNDKSHKSEAGNDGIANLYESSKTPTENVFVNNEDPINKNPQFSIVIEDIICRCDKNSLICKKQTMPGGRL